MYLSDEERDKYEVRVDRADTVAMVLDRWGFDDVEHTGGDRVSFTDSGKRITLIVFDVSDVVAEVKS